MFTQMEKEALWGKYVAKEGWGGGGLGGGVGVVGGAVCRPRSGYVGGGDSCLDGEEAGEGSWPAKVSLAFSARLMIRPPSPCMPAYMPTSELPVTVRS